MFNLNRKIEEIRQKPEYIRMRYVWAWLAICMVFIFAIWVFSVKENFSAVDFGEGNFPDLRGGQSSLQESLPSFEGLKESGQQSISELENEIEKVQ